MGIFLYSNAGNIKSEIKKLSYTGTFMGECFVMTTISSPEPLQLELGDYTVFRNERFTINYTPPKEKKAKKGSNGEAFVYENIKLNSLCDELTRCDFFDYVLNDNLLHYSGLPFFKFYANSVQDLADRIQANLDRLYKGSEKWTITVDPSFVSAAKEISIDKMNCWNALTLTQSEFGANFIVKGRDITIGTAGIAVGKVFGYGKGKGLYDIQQVTNEDAKLITRLRVFGSRRNMPNKYYNKLKDDNGKSYIPELYYAPELRLPDFPKIDTDPYLDSPNIDKYGIREGSVFFDGSNDNVEIFPSLEGMTKAQLNSAGISVSLQTGDNGKIDELLGADNPTDNGEIPEEPASIQKYFKFYLKDLGFDLAAKDSNGDYKYATSDKMQIAVESGMCTARKFDITENGIKKDTSLGYTRYVVECFRFTDESTLMAYPNKDWQIKAGDRFVILGIDLPKVYIEAAGEKLLNAGKEYLPKVDKTQFTYVPKVDEIFMANNPEIGKTIKEGDIFNFDDTDLDIDCSVIIQTLKIEYNEGAVPTYEITLSDKRIASTIEKMQESITQLATNQVGITLKEVKSLIISLGTHHFLSRWHNDTAEGNMIFKNNVSIEKDLIVHEKINAKKSVNSDLFGNSSFTSGQFGSGFRIWKDANNGQSYAELDNLMVRREMIINTLTIAEIKSVGGQILVSLAAIECNKVEASGSDYKCYFDDDNGTILNQFAINDQVICRRFDSKKLTYYWRRVISTGTNFIVLSKTDADGSGVPAIGDEMIQFGNRTNIARQSAIIISAYGSDAPSIKQYSNVNSYNLTNKEATVISPSGNKFTGIFEVKTHNGNVRIPADRGKWKNTDSYGFYDRVSHNGALWLCIVAEGTTTTEIPSDIALNWEKQVAEGQKGEQGLQGVTGKDGRDGINGTNGINGSSSYFHVRYSANANGNPMVTAPAKYIGTAVTQSMVAPTVYTAYTWYEWKGAQGANGTQGIAGKDGVNGQTSYLHIKYSNDGGKTFTGNGGENTGDWIGQYVDFVQSDSNDVKKYQWSRIRGDAGTLNYVEWKDVWTAGNGVISGWNNNGTATENIREYGLNPFGITSLLWKCVPDTGGNAAGGWSTSSVLLDNRYAYRYCVFVRKMKSGTTYHGCYDVLNLNGTANGNPYFWSGSSLRAGEWFLMVGIVQPNSVTSNSGIGGVYDMQGRKYSNGTDFKFPIDGTNVRFRSYLYYTSNATDLQYFYNPMVHRMDGTEPSIDELLQIKTSTIVDSSFEILDNKIASKVSQTDFNSLGGRVSAAESKIEQQAGQITSTVSKIEGKNAVFKSYTSTEKPSIPYAKNDIWITYDGRILQAVNTRLSGAFVEADWRDTTKYTDDTAANLAFSAATQKIRYIRDWLNGSNVNTGNHWVQIKALDNNGINIALNKTVLGDSTDKRITNGNTDSNSYASVSAGLRNIIIDLGAAYDIEKVEVWHYYVDGRTYNATKTGVSLDGKNWYTIFDSAKEGKYIETSAGRTYFVKDYDKVRVADEKADKAKMVADTAKTTAEQAKTSATTANSLLSDIANDNKLTATEKQDTKKEWDAIVAEHSKNVAQANTFAVATTSYTNAYNILSAYITPLLSNLTATSNITGTDFRAKFASYYNNRTDLLNAIAMRAKDLASATSYQGGKILYRDVDFRNGLNSIATYNNTGNGNTIITRIAKPTDCPTTSPYCIQIKNIGAASPALGGFFWGTSSRNGAKFVVKIIAKIPTGYSISWHSNATGTGGYAKWVTSTAGTGKYEEYLCIVQCGTSGTFSSTNFFALNGVAGTAAAPVYWYVALATVYDMTQAEIDYKSLADAAQNTADAKNKTYYSDTVPAIPTGGHKMGDLWYKISITNGCYTTYRWNGSTWVIINEYVSKAQQTITNNSITNLVTKTGINSLGSGETLFSKINQTDNKISLEVGKIQVGARNLLINSNFINSFANWGSNGGTRTIENDAVFGKVAKIVATGASQGIYQNPSIRRFSGRNYVISGYMKAVANMNVVFSHEGGNGTKYFTVTTAWQRFETQGIWNSGGSVCFYSGSAGTFYLANLQYEEGTKSSAWNVALEDIPQIAGSSLTLTDNKISLGAKTIELKGNTIAKAILAEDLIVGNRSAPAALEVKKNGTFYAKGSNSTSSLEIDSQNQMIEFKNNQGIYTETNGIKNVTQTTSIRAADGIFESRNSDNNTAYMSSQGIFANRAGITPYSAVTGMNIKTSIAGLGFGAMNKSYFSNWGLVGVFGRAYNSATSNPAPAYGGWFDVAKINGLCLGVRRISATTTLSQNDTYVSCYNTGNVDVHLPPNPYEGTTILFRRVNQGNIHIFANGKQIHIDGGLVNDMWHKSARGDTSVFIFDGLHWMFNYWVR